MMKTILGAAAFLLIGLVVIGMFTPPPPTVTRHERPLVPDRLYPANPKPTIPAASEPASPAGRRLTTEQRTQQLHATIRRYGSPGARSWEDVMRGMLIGDIAVRLCPQLAFNRQAADDISAAWNLDLGGDAAKPIIEGVTRIAVVEAGTNRAEFCASTWSRYGVDGSVASLLIRTDQR